MGRAHWLRKPTMVRKRIAIAFEMRTAETIEGRGGEEGAESCAR